MATNCIVGIFIKLLAKYFINPHPSRDHSFPLHTFLFFFPSKPTPLPRDWVSHPSTIPTKEHHLRSSPTSFQPPFSGQLIGNIFKAFRCLRNRFEGSNVLGDGPSD